MWLVEFIRNDLEVISLVHIFSQVITLWYSGILRFRSVTLLLTECTSAIDTATSSLSAFPFLWTFTYLLCYLDSYIFCLIKCPRRKWNTGDHKEKDSKFFSTPLRLYYYLITLFPFTAGLDDATPYVKLSTNVFQFLLISGIYSRTFLVCPFPRSVWPPLNTNGPYTRPNWHCRWVPFLIYLFLVCLRCRCIDHCCIPCPAVCHEIISEFSLTSL